MSPAAPSNPVKKELLSLILLKDTDPTGEWVVSLIPSSKFPLSIHFALYYPNLLSDEHVLATFTHHFMNNFAVVGGYNTSWDQ